MTTQAQLEAEVAVAVEYRGGVQDWVQGEILDLDRSGYELMPTHFLCMGREASLTPAEAERLAEERPEEHERLSATLEATEGERGWWWIDPQDDGNVHFAPGDPFGTPTIPPELIGDD